LGLNHKVPSSAREGRGQHGVAQLGALGPSMPFLLESPRTIVIKANLEKVLQNHH
jgi:hypothetical protein